MSARRPADLWLLGQVEYEDGLSLMSHMVEAVKAGAAPQSLFLLEHPHTITLGRRAQHHNVLLNGGAADRLGVGVFETGRGGDVTYHGPGQIVGYPILDLKPDRQDAHRYVRDLEEVIIRALADYGIAAGRVQGLTGVWVGQEKIAAIGVRLSRWVTSHGFALNVNTDLSAFNWIVPCGITDKGVTSLGALLGNEVPIPQVAARLTHHLQQVFDLELRPRQTDIRRSVQVVLARRRPTGWQALAIRRVPALGGFWQPVTGRIEAGELPAQAAVREALEETGLSGDLNDLDYVHHVMLDPAVAWGLPVPTVFEEHGFWMEVSGEPSLDPSTHDAAEWLPMAAAAQRVRWVGNRKAIERVTKLLSR